MSSHEEIYTRFLHEIESTSIEASSASPFWLERCRQIRTDATHGSRYDFLRWPSLGDFSVPESWIPLECYDDLRSSPDWDRRWEALTRDTKVGAPKDFSKDFGTSPILIQHAYHLMRYETATAKSLLDCDVIFEIGGGYGSFCRLLRNAGFAGLHMIYDLPHVSAIQRLYLSLSGFTEVPCEAAPAPGCHRFCLIADEQLDAAFRVLSERKLNVGFVATWSLSETPMSVRDRIFPRFHQVCTRYLIAFQPTWEGIGNADYFDSVRRSRPELDWRTGAMPRVIVPPSLYLFA